MFPMWENFTHLYLDEDMASIRIVQYLSRMASRGDLQSISKISTVSDLAMAMASSGMYQNGKIYFH